MKGGFKIDHALIAFLKGWTHPSKCNRCYQWPQQTGSMHQWSYECCDVDPFIDLFSQIKWEMDTVCTQKDVITLRVCGKTNL